MINTLPIELIPPFEILFKVTRLHCFWCLFTVQGTAAICGVPKHKNNFFMPRQWPLDLETIYFCVLIFLKFLVQIKFFDVFRSFLYANIKNKF